MSNVIQTAQKAQTGEEKAKPPRQDTAPEIQSEAANIVANEGPEVTAKMAMLYVKDQGSYQQVLEGIKQTYGPAAADQFHADVLVRVNRVQSSENPEKLTQQAAGVETTQVAESIVNRLGATQQSVDQREEEEAKNAPPEARKIPPEQLAAEQNIIDQNRARAEQTAALLNDLGPKIGVDPSKIPIKADQEAKAVAEQHGASGLMMAKDSQVYLHPDEYNPSQKEGQRLLGEEVAHWAQMHNALAGGGSEVTATPAAESEAKRIADDFAAGRTPAPPRESISQGAIAADVGEAGPPSRVILNLGGVNIEAQIPPTTEPRVTLRGLTSPIPGVTLAETNLEFDSNWQVTRGTVKANILIGSFINVANAELSIEPGGAIACTVENVELRVGNWGSGHMDLALSADGITGSANFNHEQMVIGMGIVLLSGSMRVSLGTEGNISAVGNLSGEIPGVGTITLNGAAENDILGGTISFSRRDPLQITGGVVMESAVLSGNFTAQAFTVTGEATVKVNEWVRGTLQGTYEHPNRTWFAHGTLHQIQPLAVGEMTITEGLIGITLENGNLTEVSGGGKFTMPRFRGSLGGTYDVAANQFAGKAQAELTEEVPLGGSGAILKRANGEALVEANQLVEIKAGAVVEVPFQEQPTFLVEARDCSYLVREGTFSGSGIATLLRDLTFGSPGGVRAVVEAGASAEGKVTDNQLTEVKGTLDASVHDDQGQFISIALEGSFDAAGGTGFSGSGEATVTREKKLYGIAGYEFWLTQGAGATAQIKENALEKVTGKVPFMVKDGQAEPLIVGSAEGEYITETGKFSGTGDVRLGRDVEFQLGGGTKIVFKKDSGGNGQVQESQLRKLGGTLNCELHTADGPLVSIGAQGEYDAVANKLLWAEGSATLLRPFELLGGKVILSNIQGNARIEENKLVSAGGAGTITVPSLNNMTGDFNVNWRNEGGKDIYSGSGKINFTLNENFGGTVDVQYNEDNTFRIFGEVDFTINEMLKGKIGVEVDQNLDPILNGELKIEGVELVPSQDLFNFEFPIVPGMNFGPYYGINIKVGADAGLKASMQALTLTTTIGIENFHPLQMNMPDFSVRVDLNTGLTFEAAAKPYVGVTAGVQGLEAGIAVEGEVRLTVPVNISPYALLKGGPEGFNGELGIGVSIVPRLDLFVRPYLFAILGSEEARKDLVEWKIPLGELFKWEWNGKYKWGDQGEQKEEGGAPAATEAPSGGTQSQAKQETGGVEGFSKGGGGAAQASPGGPKLESPSEREAAQKGGQGGGPMDDIQKRFQAITDLAEKVANAAYLFSVVMDIVKVAMMSGVAAPASVAVYLAYRVFVVGDITFEKIKKAVLDLWSLLQQGFDWIKAHLPDWFNDVLEWVRSADPMGALKNASEWLANNLKQLGQQAIDFLKDAGDWGNNIIKGAGAWAMEAAGWAMEAISDVGEGIANVASSAWETVSSWF